MHSEKFKHIILLYLILCLFSCGTYVSKEARGLDESELAILDTKFPFFSPSIYVTFVNGESRGFGDFDSYKLAPGETVITVSGNSQLGLYENHTDIMFNAEAGKVYKLVYEGLGGGNWSAKIINKETSERVDYEQTYPDCGHSLLGNLKCTHKKESLNQAE